MHSGELTGFPQLASGANRLQAPVALTTLASRKRFSTTGIFTPVPQTGGFPGMLPTFRGKLRDASSCHKVVICTCIASRRTDLEAVQMGVRETFRVHSGCTPESTA